MDNGDTRDAHAVADERDPTFCPDCGEVERPSALVQRCKGLLARLRSLTAPREERRGAGDESAPSPGRQLLPVTWLGCLAGVEPADLRQAAAVLRWAARLAGEPLSLAAGAGRRRVARGEGHALLVARRFAEIEHGLERLQEHLAVVVPLWFGGSPPGQATWIDVEQPPARLPAAELAQLDLFLAMATALGGDTGGLSYRCPRGLLYSTRRLVAVRASWEEAVGALTEQLRLFAARLRDVMSAAVETGDGFLVETGLAELRPDEEQFVALGAALGYWRWLGPAGAGAYPLVDLLSLADSPTVKTGQHGWRLLSEVFAERHAFATGTPAAGAETDDRQRQGLRRLLGARDDAKLADAVARVGRLAGGSQEHGQLIVKGLLGTGRHEALARGLAWSQRHAADPGELTVYCPDTATAAMVARQTLRAGLVGPLDLRVPAAGELVELGQPAGAELADPASAVVAMCEVQRFEPETRYRIAQLGRGRRLLMTVDPAAAHEPWEHLFLTTPRSDEILVLREQRRLTRRLWQEVARLLPAGQELGGTALRRDKGRLTAEYAANLDQGLARLTAAHAGGELGDRLRVTAPLPGDIDYLCAGLLERGWAAVAESRLDFLLLPGPREILAAATDALAATGVLAARYPRAAAAPAEPRADAANDDAQAPLLPRLLGPSAARTWRRAAARQAAAVDEDLAAFIAKAGATPWGRALLALPSARRRVEQLSDAWGAEPVTALPTFPLWEAWWSTMRDDLLPASATPARSDRRPVALLSEAGRRAGGCEPGGVYLCQGSEPAQQHYEVLGRITDQALVLYQERSPLAQDAH